MTPDDKEIDDLLKALSSRHGLKFDELVNQSKQLATYIKGLGNFNFVAPDPLLDIPHIGRVIVDAVLQVGHDYEKQVRKRVEYIKNYDEAVTVSGFLRILKELAINELLDWNSPAMEMDLLAVGNFFANRGIETYSELKEWLKLEDNRDSLLSERSGLGGNSTFRVADKTADYFRVLVSHWDAVAVDSNIKAILENAHITSKYNYKEMQAIVHLAALEMNLRPIDLDASIYNDSVVHPERYKRSNKRRQHDIDGRSGKMRITEGESVIIGSMPQKGDIFKGKINDLYLWDADDGNGKWRRRDISFFKRDIHRHEKFGYPTRSDQITLIDTEGNRYEMNFSKPETKERVCLGTPSRLKSWYRKKGFDDKVINPNNRIYFEYTGQGSEFIILTEQEYSSRHMENLLT
jgi:hypothetical protein